LISLKSTPYKSEKPLADVLYLSGSRAVGGSAVTAKTRLHFSRR